jgi:hypothetical protein
MRRLLTFALVVAALAAAPTPAEAACAAPPSPPPTFHDMVKSGTTFNDFFHRMIVGRVVTIRDPGKSGGDAIAVISLAARPTGFVPRVARVRFYLPPSGQSVEDNLVFIEGQRWVVIARHLKDGDYRSDGFCGLSRTVSQTKLHNLIVLDRRSH